MKGYHDYECLHALCRARKSRRDFLEQPVPGEAVEKILAIAYTAPYASNKKNWQVLVINEKKLIENIAAAVEQKARQLEKNIREDLKEGFALYARDFVHFRSAPVLLLPVFRVGKSFSYMMADAGDSGSEEPFSAAQWERDNYVKSISCVCMLILLAAQGLGLGSCFMTGPLIAEQEIARLVNIKKGRQLAAVIPIGYYKMSDE